MKTKLVTALNTASRACLDTINSARGVWQEMSLGEGEKESRYRFVRYGEFPVEMVIDGRLQRVIQVIDRTAAEEMASNFAALGTKLATFFKGIPVYEGHADDPDWQAQNPGYKPAAVGRIKEITPGEDGILVRTVFNERGVAMLSGEAPEYSGHSPRWRMKEIPDRPGHYRPFLLWSDALTNSPNIPDSGMALNQSPSSAAGAGDGPEKPNQSEMKLTPEALKALGFAPDASPSESEISAAIVKLLGEKTTAESAKTTAEGALTAANSRITVLTTEVTELRETGVADAINTAITAGRISEAEKDTWTNILKADFKSGSAALSKLPAGKDALNDRKQTGDLGKRKGEGEEVATGGIDAMNSAAKAYAKDRGIDISTASGWTEAWEGARAAKPEVFQRTQAQEG